MPLTCKEAGAAILLNHNNLLGKSEERVDVSYDAALWFIWLVLFI